MDNKALEKLIREYEEHAKQIERATYLNINETTGEKAKRVAGLEKKYSSWFEYYFPQYATAKCSWFHNMAINLMMKFKIIYLILEWFRGAAKSVHVSMGFPLYLMIKKEMRFMLLIGENEKKAIRLLSDIHLQLKHNRRFINDYGSLYKYGDWASGSFTTKDDVHFHCLGYGQDPRGLRYESQRPDYIVVDDIDTRKRCNNQRLVDEAIEYITSTLWGCFDVGRERFVMANNNIHKNSILNNLIKFFKQAKKEAGKNNEENIHHHIKVNAVDKNGDPTWPEKYTKEYWRKKKAGIPLRSWLREYMNTPVEKGKIFLHKWMQHKDMLRLNYYEGLVFYGDLSYKATGDYKAMYLIGKIAKEFHVIHSFCRQTSRYNVAVWLYDLYERRKLNRFNIHYYIEGLFAQDEFVNDFDEVGNERKYHIPVVADTRPKGNKFDRIESISGFFERLNFFFNIEEKDHADQIMTIDQLTGFEKGSGMPDDGPDAIQGGVDKLNKITFIEAFEPRISSYSEQLNKNKNRY